MPFVRGEERMEEEEEEGVGCIGGRVARDMVR